MNYNIKLFLGSMLILAMPTVQAMHETAESSWHDTTTHDDPTQRERDELQRRLQRSRVMPEHDWAYQSRRTAVDSTQTPVDQPEATRAKFAKKTVTQKISDFFSNLFGKKAIIDDKLLTHSLKSRDPRTTEDALTTKEDKELFQSLSDDQQEKSLNRWLTVERNQFNAQQIADRETYDNNQKTLEKTRKYVKSANEKLIKESNQAGDEISKVLRNVKNNYPNINPAVRKYLSEVNNSVLAVKGTDMATNSDKQKTLHEAVNKLLDLLDPKKFSTDKLKTILSDRAILEKSLKTISDNDAAIRKNRADLTNAREKVEKDNVQQQLNTQETFNRRLVHFRNEIQGLLPADRELKYNQTTGKFEYHTKLDLNTKLTNYDQLSHDQKIEAMKEAIENFENLTPEQQDFVIRTTARKGSGIYNNLSSEVKQKYISIVLGRPKVTKEQSQQDTTTLRDDVSTTPEPAREEASVSSSDFTEAPGRTDIQVEPAGTPGVPESREQNYQQAVTTLRDDVSTASEPVREEAKTLARELYDDVRSEQQKQEDYDKFYRNFVLKSAEEEAQEARRIDRSTTLTVPEKEAAISLDKDTRAAFEDAVAVQTPTEQQYHFGEEPTTFRARKYPDNIDDLLQRFSDEQ